MPIPVRCEACEAELHLKDQYAGLRVKCPKCATVITVPEAVTVEVAPEGAHDGGTDPIFGRDTFLLRQKLVAISAKYSVWDENGDTLLYIERPAHLLRNVAAAMAAAVAFLVLLVVVLVVGDQTNGQGPIQAIAVSTGVLLLLAVPLSIWIAILAKRHITFYRDDSKTERLLEILQDKKFAVLNATYTVNDPQGTRLARFRKNYIYNILRKRWYGYLPDGSELVVAKEDSLLLALLRRYLGPLFGALRTNFVILKPDQQTVLGEFNRKFTLLDRYVLDMSHDPDHYLDRRLAVALGVLLDTGERR